MTIARPIFGVDVHANYQSGFDFARAKADGYQYAIIKASEGPYLDGSVLDMPGLDTFAERCKRSGLLMGFYHFLIETHPEAQAEHFVRSMERLGGFRGRFIAIDFEAYNPPHDYLTPSNETLRAFVTHLRRRVGDHPLILYSGRHFWNGGISSGPAARYDVDATWDAYYQHMLPISNPRIYYTNTFRRGWGQPWGNETPMFWQFTAAGLVAGRNIDVNAFRGTKTELIALTRGGRVIPKPPPPPPPPGPKPKPDKDWLGPRKEPTPPVIPGGTWMERHPTRYGFRKDVRGVVDMLFTEIDEISINTYADHPEGWSEQLGYDTSISSLDLWHKDGRGVPVHPHRAFKAIQLIFEDPNPPYVAWAIWQGYIWTWETGEWRPWADDGTGSHHDHLHVTFQPVDFVPRIMMHGNLSTIFEEHPNAEQYVRQGNNSRSDTHNRSSIVVPANGIRQRSGIVTSTNGACGCPSCCGRS